MRQDQDERQKYHGGSEFEYLLPSGVEADQADEKNKCCRWKRGDDLWETARANDGEDENGGDQCRSENGHARIFTRVRTFRVVVVALYFAFAVAFPNVLSVVLPLRTSQ